MVRPLFLTGSLTLFLLVSTSCNTPQGTTGSTPSGTQTSATASPVLDLDHSNRKVIEWQERYAGTLLGN